MSDCDDLKGYASDSTVSHLPPCQDQPIRKKRKCKDRGGGEQRQVHHTKEHKVLSPPRLPPLNLGMVRMKSTGSILNTLDYTPDSILWESHESLLSDSHNRHKMSVPRRPSRPERSHMAHRRGSVDNGMGQVGKVCGACGGGLTPCKPGLAPCKPGLSPCKPPRRGTKPRDDSRHQGKERTLRCRDQSRSFKGEKERSRKTSLQEEEEEEICIRKTSLNRSLSFSSVGDYEGTQARVHFEPIHSSTSTSGSKWIVYGFV